MKKLALFLMIMGITSGCWSNLKKDMYTIEIAVIRADKIHKIEKTCPYNILCGVDMKIIAQGKYSAADVKIETLRKDHTKEKGWYFKVDIKTRNALGVEYKTSRTLETTEEKLVKDPVIYQSPDLGRIEVKIVL
jgi:predicted component of type VI protein secretion system